MLRLDEKDADEAGRRERDSCEGAIAFLMNVAMASMTTLLGRCILFHLVQNYVISELHEGFLDLKRSFLEVLICKALSWLQIRY